MSDQNPRAVIGGNKATVEELFRDLTDELPQRLKDDCGEVIERAEALVKNAAVVPDVIQNEDEEAKASDIVMQMKKHQKVADSRRLGISALPRQAQSMINNYFSEGAIDPLQKACDRIEPGVTKWKRIKAEKERREREEKERLAREEAERQRKEAEDAQRRQREAEAARQRAVEEQKRAEEAARKAKEETAAAEVRRAEAEKRRADAEVAAQEAETKRAKAKAEREVKEAAEAAAKAEREKQEAKDRQERERVAVSAAKTDVALAKGDVSDASKEVKTAVSMAKHAEADAGKAARHAGAKISELSSVRGDLGSQSSLRTRWVGTFADRDKVDKVALWDCFSDSQIQEAVTEYVRRHKGSRKLRGVDIFETTDTAFRG